MKTFLLKIIFIIPVMCTVQYGYSQVDSAKLDNLSLRDLLNVKITTASKTTQTAELASAVVTVVTKEQIRLRGYQSLLDVMYDLRDVKVDDKMFSGIRNSFTIRGLQGSEKFVILLDGINISSPSGEAMPIMQNYPVNLAEQIEILYGPSSALYGANAVSGIINIITKKTKKDLTADVTTTAGDYGYTNTTVFLSKKLAKDVSVVVSGQYYYDRSPDYSKVYKHDSLSSVASYATGTLNSVYGPFTPIVPIKAAFQAPMEAYNIYAALRASDFSFTFFRSFSKTPTSFGSNTSNAVFNKDVYMAQGITTANAAYKKTFNKITSTTSLTASKYDLAPGSNYRNLYTSMERAYKYSTCTMIGAEEQIDYQAADKLNITAGARFDTYNCIPQSTDLASLVDKNSYIHGTALGTTAYYRPEGLEAQFFFIRYNNIGSYLQAQYSPAKKIQITAGARYDWNSRYGGSFNPRLGIVYQPHTKTTIKLLYGSAFRAPSPSDAYAQYGSFITEDSGKTYHSNFLHLPNPGLKPVISHTTELNIQQQLCDNVFVSVDGYYTALSGLFVYSDDNETSKLYHNMFHGTPVDYIEVFTNNNRQKTYGGSIQLNWKGDINDVQINSFASLSIVGGKNESGLKERNETVKDIQLDFVSPVMVHAGMDMKWNKFSFAPRLILMGRQHIAGIGDTTSAVIKRQTLAGYALVNVSVRYNLSEHFSIYSNVSNALNQRYKNVSFNTDLDNPNNGLYNGQPQDPIRIMAGINFTF